MPISRSSVLQTGVPTPAASGLSAWAYDPAQAGNSSLLVAGTVYLVKLVNPPADTVTKVYWAVAAAAVSPVSGQNEAGLYASDGTRLAATNVDADITSTGLKTTTITGQLLTPGSFVWAAFLFNSATPPTLARSFSGTAAAAAAHAGLTAAGYRFAIAGTSQTSLPSSITPSSNTAATFGLWAAVGV